MYTVTIRSPDGAEITHPLGLDQGLVVGRDETCDIVLPSARVSRRHARFFTLGEQLHIEDLGSQNGVYVGGVRITGVNEVRPGPAIEVGEYQIRIRRREPEAAGREGEARAAGFLVGTGALKGKRFELGERSVLGRERGVEALVEHDSVSRRHAELWVDEGRMLVRDLGSSNGTFVNGRRLESLEDLPIRPGDEVGFGETRFRFVAGPALATTGSGTRSVIIVACLLLLIGGLVAASFLQPGESAVPAVEAGPTGLELAEDALARGRSLLEEERWEEARAAFEEARQNDPVNVEARRLARRAAAELRDATLLREAAAKSEVGQDAAALEQLFQISQESRTFARARLRVNELAASFAERQAKACRESAQARRWERALESCRWALDLTCHRGPDAALVKLLRDAEKAGGAQAAWSCPEHLAPWFPSAAATDDAGARAIAARYPDKDVREAVLAYVRGDVDAARSSAVGIKGAAKAAATELAEHLLVVDGRYKEGHSALMRNDLARAEQSFKQALERDERIVPPPGRSFFGRQMRSSLAQGYLRAGREAFERNLYSEAFQNWSRGLAYLPSEPALLDGVARLEKVAAGLAAQGGCNELEQAMGITAPTSAVHQKAARQHEQTCR